MSRAKKKPTVTEAFQQVIDASLAMSRFQFLDGIPYEDADRWPKQVHDRINALVWQRTELENALKVFADTTLPELRLVAAVPHLLAALDTMLDAGETP